MLKQPLAQRFLKIRIAINMISAMSGFPDLFMQLQVIFYDIHTE